MSTKQLPEKTKKTSQTYAIALITQNGTVLEWFHIDRYPIGKCWGRDIIGNINIEIQQKEKKLCR